MKKTLLSFLFLFIITGLQAENGSSINAVLKSLERQSEETQLSLISEGIEKFPGSLRLYILKAKLEINKGTLSAAETTLKAALSQKLEDPELYNLLGLCSFHLQKKSEAAQYFKKTLQTDPANNFAKYYLSILDPVTPNLPDEESTINISELLKEYADKGLDSSSSDDYVFLLQKKELDIKNSRLYDYSIHSVVKIRTEQGIRRFRNFSQSFNNYEYYPEVLIARTYGTDGTYKDADLNSVVITSGKNSGTIYSNRKSVAFPFANLQVGSVVEYKIRFISTGNSLSHKVFNQFFFGTEITTMKKVFSVSYPEHIQLSFSRSGSIVSEETIKNGIITTRTFTSHYPPLYNLENETISFYDLSPGVTISASSSWDELNEWYAGLFYQAVGDKTGILQNLRIEKSDSKTAIIEKVYQYIQEQISYSAIELGIGALVPHAPSETLKNKYGDCKDQVILTISLLNEAGIDARPALISTMDNGRISKELAGIGYFNHMITYIPEQQGIEKPFFIDTTNSYTSFGNLPYQVQDRNAFIVSRDKRAFFTRTPLVGNRENRMEESYLIRVNPIGKAEMELTQLITGSFSEFFRTQIGRADSTAKKQYFFKMQKQTYPELKEENFILTGSDTTSGNIFVSCKTETPNATQVFFNGEQNLTLSLDNIESLFSYPASTQYLYTKNFLYSYKKRLEYIFPEGYKVTEQNLRNLSRSNSYIEFHFKSEKIKENHFVFEYEIAVKEREILPEDLEFINRYLAGITQMVNFKITLAKEKDFDYVGFFDMLSEAYPRKEVYSNYIERMIQLENIEQAIKVCTKGEELFPDETYFNLVLSVIHTEAEEYDQAENELHKALEKEKDNFDIYRYLIGLYSTSKDNEKLEKTLLEAQKKFTDKPAVTEELINFYQRTNKIDKAIALLEEQIEKTPDVSKYYSDLGYLYSLQKDFDNAELNFLKAIEIDAKNAFALNNLAWLYCENDTKLDKAIEYVLEACKLDPYNDNFFDTLAEAYFKTGQYDLAIEAIEKAISINPNYTYLKQQKKKIEDAKKSKNQQDENGKQ